MGGFYNPHPQTLFFKSLEHKIELLDAAFEFFASDSQQRQEFPDNIGTHTLLIKPDGKSITLAEVVSWQLNVKGELNITLVDKSRIRQTPVLIGDDYLILAYDNPQFRTFSASCS
jgi:hypothetical protein